MTLLILVIILWVAMSGEISLANVGTGFVLGLILLAAGGGAMNFRNVSMPTDKIPLRLWRLARFIAYFLVELVLAGFSVFLSILNPSRLRPGVVAVPLDLESDFEITLLANLITLTPGTLTLEVFKDQNLIYVHTVFLENPESFRASIKNGFERRIKELSQL